MKNIVPGQINKFKLFQKDLTPGSAVSLKAEEQLKVVLTPQYSWLFKFIGRLENGVKFLVDLRTDVLVSYDKTPRKETESFTFNSRSKLILGQQNIQNNIC